MAQVTYTLCAITSICGRWQSCQRGTLYFHLINRYLDLGLSCYRLIMNFLYVLVVNYYHCVRYHQQCNFLIYYFERLFPSNAVDLNLLPISVPSHLISAAKCSINISRGLINAPTPSPFSDIPCLYLSDFR